MQEETKKSPLGRRDTTVREDTHDALINLATAEAAERDTMMNQSKTITDLTYTTTNFTQKLQ